MTYDEFDAQYADDTDLFDLHMKYILDHGDSSEYTICDGDTLVLAAEWGYLYEAFRDDYLEKNH